MTKLIRTLMISGMCMLLLAPHAHADESFEKEFQAFKEKLNKAQQEKQQPQAVAQSPVLQTREVGNVPAVNPLGPAGRLPVKGQQPATFAAMQQRLTPEQMRAQAQEEMKRQKEQLQKEYFQSAVKSMLPLEPEQIRAMLEEFRKSREAAETPIAIPEPKTEVATVPLDPSALPMVINVSPGYVTTITMVDATGAPWAIQDVSWAGKFDVTGPEKGGHIVRLVPKSAHGVGNISIRLIDLNTPLTFSLRTGLEEVHYRFDARIPALGPLARPPIVEYGGLDSVVGTDENLVQFLEGTPPRESMELSVNGVDGRTRAWKAEKRIYLRTPLTLLSPSWESSVTSSDGMNVYTFNNTPVVLLSDQGKMVEAHIMAGGGSL